MKKEIKSVLVKHPILGEITIINGLNEDLNKLIGTETIKRQDIKPIYHAEIDEIENGLSIYNLCKIEAETINIGWKKIGTGHTTYITLYTNRQVDGYIKIYTSGILSIICE